MRWRSDRESNNVEDRRGMGLGGGGGGGLRFGFIGTIVVVLIGWMLGADPMRLLDMMGGTDALIGNTTSTTSFQPETQNGQLQDDNGRFASTVLARTEDVWNPMFQQMGMRYQEPKLVLFTDQTQSACGFSSAATGPFYCPADEKVYVDLGFFNELKRLGGSDGDFARAYVIGHEVGHHVQNQLGITDKVTQLQARSNERNSNALSVALELQADCFAGVWANRSDQQKAMLEQGDIEQAIQSASAIGDDRLQRMSGRFVNPDSFTHGSAKQRVAWFKRGLDSGDINNCDTFANL